MTASELARKLGLTRQAVSKLNRRGMPLDSLDAAQKWRAVHAAPRQKNFILPATEDVPTPFDDALDRVGRARAAEGYAYGVLKAAAESRDIRLTGRALRDFLTASRKAAETEQAAVAAGLAQRELIRTRDIVAAWDDIIQPFFHRVEMAERDEKMRWYVDVPSVAKEMRDTLMTFARRLVPTDLFAKREEPCEAVRMVQEAIINAPAPKLFHP